MESIKNVKHDLLIIHTNLYTGNFDKDLTQFVFDVKFDGFSHKNANDYKDFDFNYDYSMFNNLILNSSDNIHIDVPSLMHPSPFYGNNGVGFHFRFDDLKKQKEAVLHYNHFFEEEYNKKVTRYKQAISEFDESGNHGQLYNAFLKSGLNVAAIQKLIDNLEINTITIDDLIVRGASNSIAIAFKKGTITPDLINLVKKRANDFINVHLSNINKYRKTTDEDNLIIEDVEISIV